MNGEACQGPGDIVEAALAKNPDDELPVEGHERAPA